MIATIWPFLRVFLLAFGVDVLWARCVTAVARGEPREAAFFSGFLTYLGATITLSYVSTPELKWAAVMGAAAGAFAVVRAGKWAQGGPPAGLQGPPAVTETVTPSVSETRKE